MAGARPPAGLRPGSPAPQSATQRRAKLPSQTLRVAALAFPDHGHFETSGLQLSSAELITPAISRELRSPECAIAPGSGRLCTSGMSMPEAAMNEHCEPPTTIRQIRRSRKIPIGKRIAQTEVARGTTHGELRRRAALADSCHSLGDPLRSRQSAPARQAFLGPLEQSTSSIRARWSLAVHRVDCRKFGPHALRGAGERGASRGILAETEALPRWHD